MTTERAFLGDSFILIVTCTARTNLVGFKELVEEEGDFPDEAHKATFVAFAVAVNITTFYANFIGVELVTCGPHSITFITITATTGVYGITFFVTSGSYCICRQIRMTLLSR